MRRLIGLYSPKMKHVDIYKKLRRDLKKMGLSEIDSAPGKDQAQVIFFKNKPQVK